MIESCRCKILLRIILFSRSFLKYEARKALIDKYAICSIIFMNSVSSLDTTISNNIVLVSSASPPSGGEKYSPNVGCVRGVQLVI